MTNYTGWSTNEWTEYYRNKAMTDAATKQSFLMDYFGENPETAFSSFISKQDPAMQNYFKNSYNDLYSEYLGMLGNQATTTNELPTLKFTDYLNSLNLNERYAGQTSYQKGFYNPAKSPRAKWLMSY